jgi:hypothetical protein
LVKALDNTIAPWQNPQHTTNPNPVTPMSTPPTTPNPEQPASTPHARPTQLPGQSTSEFAPRKKAWFVAAAIGGVALLLFCSCAGIGGIVAWMQLSPDTSKRDASVGRASNAETPAETRARMEVRSIEQAAKTYWNNNGVYPESLQDLTTRQPNGSAPLLKPQALLDPWNQPYRYEPANRHRDSDNPHIYSPGEPGKNQPISNWD